MLGSGQIDVNGVSNWLTAADERRLARQLAGGGGKGGKGGKGWFREHQIFVASYGQGGTYVMVRPQTVPRDERREREYVRDTSGMNRSALHAAAEGGHTPVVLLLLASGADPLRADSSGRVPLHAAAQHGHAGAVLALLQGGGEATDAPQRQRAQLESADHGGRTACHLALDRLLAQRRGGNGGAAWNCPPPHPPGRRGRDHRAVLEALWPACVAHAGVLELGDAFGRRLRELEVGVLGTLAEAAARGDVPRTRQLLAERRVEVNAQCGLGRTALHEACEAGQLLAVRELLRAGADAFVADQCGQTALHVCARRGCGGTARELLRGLGVQSTEAFASLAAALCAVQDRTGKTALLVSVRAQHAAVAELLIAHGSLSAYDMLGLTPLRAAAALGSTTMIVALVSAAGEQALTLLNERVWVHAGMARTGTAPWFHSLSPSERRLHLRRVDGHALPRHQRRRRVAGMPALHAAIRGGPRCSDAARALLHLGADPDCIDETDAGARTAIDLAVASGQPCLVRELLAHGAAVPGDGSLVLHRALDVHASAPLHDELCALLISSYPALINSAADFGVVVCPSAYDAAKITPLGVALLRRNVRAASLLVAAGAQCQPCLSQAAIAGDSEATRFLLQQGAAHCAPEAVAGALCAALTHLSGAPAPSPTTASCRCPAPRNASHVRKHRERDTCAELLARAVGCDSCAVVDTGSQMNCLQLALSRGYWRAALYMAECASADTLRAACAPDVPKASRRSARANNICRAPLVLFVQADDGPEQLFSPLLRASAPPVVGDAIVVSARRGNIARLRELATSQLKPIDAGVWGTALKAAISAAQRGAVEFLLSLRSFSFDEQACISLAIRVGSCDILSLLFSHCNDCDMAQLSPVCSSMLPEAISRGHLALAQQLIQLLEDTGRWNDVQQTTLPSLLRAAGISNATAVLPSLLCGAENVADALNKADEFGLAPLHFAQAHGHAEIAAMFVEAGATKIARPRRMRRTTKVNATSRKEIVRASANLKYLRSFLLHPEAETGDGSLQEPGESLHMCSDAAAFHEQYQQID